MKNIIGTGRDGIVKLSRCINGHYFDSAKDKTCPYCLDKKEATEDASTSSVEIEKLEEDKGSDKGAEVVQEQRVQEFDPVTGWLVCIEGPDKGQDYKIKSEKNFVGRASNMDICIAGDSSVSKENHAIVSFNPKKRTFKVHPGEGRGLVYLNGDDIDAAKEIKSYDIIELGNTKLLFIPLCGESFGWEQT